MLNGNHTRVAARSLLPLAFAMLASVPALTQGGRRGAPNPPDIAGEWRLENNEDDTTAQPPLGDYPGIPVQRGGPPAVGHHRGVHLGNAGVSVPAALGAAPVARPRRRAHPQGTGSADARRQGLSHPVHAVAGPARLHGRAPASAGVGAAQLDRLLDRRWIGNTLKVTTTHLKDGYLKRGGPQTSDMYTMTEFITRHGDILTDRHRRRRSASIWTSRSSNPRPTPTIRRRAWRMETCNASAFAENGGTNRHWVPHFLPGQNDALTSG